MASSGGPHLSDLTWTRRLQICCPPSRVRRMWSLGHVSTRGGVGSPKRHGDAVPTPQRIFPFRIQWRHCLPQGRFRFDTVGARPGGTRLMLINRQQNQDFDRAPAMVSLGTGPILQPFYALVGRSSPGGFPPLDAPLRGHGGRAGGHQRGRLVDRPRLTPQDTGPDRPSCKAAALAHLDHCMGPHSTAIPRVVPVPPENPESTQKGSQKCRIAEDGLGG